MANDTSPYYGLPRREIVVDWAEFERLPSSDKELFIQIAEAIERGHWCGRSSYEGVHDWACVDLSEYADYDDFVRELKKAGPAFYEGRKAEKRGYYSKLFDQQSFIGDWVAINTSMPERQGKPMFESNMHTVEQLGGYLSEFRFPEIPTNSVFWLLRFGTFRPLPGHHQGPVVVNEQLVSFLSIRRFGNFANYNMLLGHHDFLRDGIVHKMHLDFVKLLLDTRNQAVAGSHSADASLAGIRYIGYGSMLGTTPGLQRWKKSNLFKPGLTLFDYSPALKESETGSRRSETVTRGGPVTTEGRITEGMIKIGTYTADDKWEILCRHWTDPGSVTEAIVDKWNAPALPNWQDLALAGGTYACLNCLSAKLDALRRDTHEGGATQSEVALDRDIAELHGRLGDDGLLQLARTLAPAIAAEGFSARLDARLPPLLRDQLREVFKAGAIGLLRWTDMRGEVPSVEVVRTRRNGFPVHAIQHKRNVLGLFCALNYGRSDVIHIHDSCPDHATLVDNNADCLNDMRLIYPSDWEYLCVDYRAYLNEAVERGRSYDLIVADPSLDLPPQQLDWDRLATVMSICTDTFISNYTRQMCDELGVAPDDLAGLSQAVKAKTGIEVAFTEMMPRNDTVYWAVMRKV